MKWTIEQDAMGRFRWRFQAPNGRVLADSGFSYARISDAARGGDRVQSSHRDYAESREDD